MENISIQSHNLDFINSIKQRTLQSQYEALKAVNKELITLYCNIVRNIVENKVAFRRGKSVVKNLAENSLGKVAEKNMVHMRNDDVQSTFVDLSGLMDNFNYKPETKLSDGIGKFVKWYREFYK